MELQWPPQGEDAQLLGQLGLLVERAGAAHLLDGPVVRPDEKDFPEPWAGTASGVEHLLNRLFWLTYVDLEVEIEDERTIHDQNGKLLRRSSIDWVETNNGVARFRIEAIGNDNVAGLLSHEVARAFLSWITAAAPYREEAVEQPSLRDGSIAAVYLGLGVVATNASLYNRAAGEQQGGMMISETEVVLTGGLSQRDLLLLLAVQAVLRGKLEDAHRRLRKDLFEKLQLLFAQLTPLRKELAAYLAIELEAPRAALQREAAPAAVSPRARTEPKFNQRSAGEYTTRRPVRRTLAGILQGVAAGFVMFLITTGVIVLFDIPKGAAGWTLAASFVVAFLGFAISGALEVRQVCKDSTCESPVQPLDEKCPGCGATVLSREAYDARVAQEEEELARQQAEAEAERAPQEGPT